MSIGYTGRSIGRLLYFLREYLRYDMAEACVFSGDKVLYNNKCVATIIWEDDIPTFEFQGVAEYGNKNQAEYKEHLVRRLLDYHSGTVSEPTKCRSTNLVREVERINSWVSFEQVPIGSFFIQEEEQENGIVSYFLCVKTANEDAFVVVHQSKDGDRLSGMPPYGPKVFEKDSRVVLVPYMPFTFNKRIHSDSVLLG